MEILRLLFLEESGNAVWMPGKVLCSPAYLALLESLPRIPPHSTAVKPFRLKGFVAGFFKLTLSRVGEKESSTLKRLSGAGSSRVF